MEFYKPKKGDKIKVLPPYDDMENCKPEDLAKSFFMVHKADRVLSITKTDKPCPICTKLGKRSARLVYYHKLNGGLIDKIYINTN